MPVGVATTRHCKVCSASDLLPRRFLTSAQYQLLGMHDIAEEFHCIGYRIFSPHSSKFGYDASFSEPFALDATSYGDYIGKKKNNLKLHRGPLILVITLDLEAYGSLCH